MPARGIQHVDIAVADVERSLAFYRMLLGPLGLVEHSRSTSYRGSEEIVYLAVGHSLLGVRPADGGSHRYYEVGLEHLAFQVDTREEVDAAHERCANAGAQVEGPPELDPTEDDYYAFFVRDPDDLRIEIVCDQAWP